MVTALKDTQVSVRLPNELKDKMEAYAQLTGRTKSHVAMEALSSYFEWRMPQMEDLKAAVHAADQCDFADSDEVAAVFSKHIRRAAKAPTSQPAARRRAK